MSQYELVIKTSKRYESWLEQKLDATGKGLHERVSSVEADLSQDIVRRFRKIASIRNQLVHQEGYELSSQEMEEFVETSRLIDEELALISVSSDSSAESISSTPQVGVWWSHQHADHATYRNANALKIIISVAIVIGVFWGLNKVDSWFSPDKPEQVSQIKSDLAAKQAVRPAAKLKHATKRMVAAKSEDVIPPALAADIQSAKPFVNEVIDKLRCIPANFDKQMEIFRLISAPNVPEFIWLGPWNGRDIPVGMCMNPGPVFGWEAEKPGYTNYDAQLSVRVKWNSPAEKDLKGKIFLRKVANVGWRVTLIQ